MTVRDLAALARLAEQEAKWQELEHPFDKSEYDAMYERMTKAEAACEKAVRERRSLEVKEDDWHTAYEHATTRLAETEQALRDATKWIDTVLAQGGPVTSDYATGEALIARRAMGGNQYTRRLFECAHGHRWEQLHGDARRCPTCGTITFAATNLDPRALGGNTTATACTYHVGCNAPVHDDGCPEGGNTTEPRA